MNIIWTDRRKGLLSTPITDEVKTVDGNWARIMQTILF